MYIHGLEDNFFLDPAEMSDSDLEREYAALSRDGSEVMADERVSDFWKCQIREHAKLVLDEYQRRKGVEIISPFENFYLI